MDRCSHGQFGQYLNSHLPGCSWPSIPNDSGAQALALQFQLEQSQWLAPEELLAAQLKQLQCVLSDVFLNVKYWNEALGKIGFHPDGPFSYERFVELPVLSRQCLQQMHRSLINPKVPAGHGKVSEGQTSGSTGTPVTFYQTDLTNHFWQALALREHFWQKRNLSGSLAAIRSNIENGDAPNWGSATANLARTGPFHGLNIRTDVGEQLDWLVAKNPDYLLTHPSNLKALAKLAIRRNIRLSKLKQLRTFGEILPDETRELCRQAWGAEIADIYSSEEAGYIAIQCEQGAYHIQSENILVEILDQSGQPARSGEIGRVVVTTLHNFAMPLVRYELGDFAEVGDRCSCGRGLPVIQRILGRQRNMLKLPDGTEHWPSFPEDQWVGVAPIQQLQVVQRALDHVVLKVKSERTLTQEEAARLIEVFKNTLGFPYRITIESVDSIARAKNSKFEDFVSELV